MRRHLLFALTIGVLSAAVVRADRPGSTHRSAPAMMAAGPARDATPQRIVSLVPATTEMIFAMGAGDRLVGVGNYDRFPPEVARLPRVGGLIDPDTERILALRPDLVIVYDTQVELKQRLARARIPIYPYVHRALPDIMATLRALGARIASAPRANAVATEMERALAAVRSSVAGRPRPKTMLVFGRDPQSVRNVHASGGYGFLSDLLEVAGGDNLFADIKQQAVQASTEMILTRRPDVIIELRYGESVSTADLPRELAAWNTLASVPAVKNHLVHVLVGDEFVVPGPRIVLAAERFARTLHPGLAK